MKNYTKYFLYLCLPVIIIGVTMISIPLTSFAAQTTQFNGLPIEKSLKEKLPSYYPNSFMSRGIVTNIDLAKRTITFSSTALAYGINTKVHTLSSNFASIQSLTIDTPVGYNFFVGSDNTFFLTEVWVLPAGSVLPH